MELLTHHAVENVLVVTYQGDNLDASNVRAFRDAMQKLMKDHTRVVLDMSRMKFVDSSGLGALVVLDMSRMKFVDSSGLGALLACLRDANGRKGDFRLGAMSPPVRALFELMRMHRVFSIHDDVAGAVSSFA